MKENCIVGNVEKALAEIKTSIVTAMDELRLRIADRLAVLEEVKRDIADTFEEVDALSDVMSNFANEISGIAEDAYDNAETLLSVLEVVNPEFVDEYEDRLVASDEDEDFDEDEDDDYEVYDEDEVDTIDEDEEPSDEE